MNSTTLRSFSRAAIQRLAKANGIKANLRTDTIIALLLEHQDAAPALGGDEEDPAHGLFNPARAQGPQTPRALDIAEVDHQEGKPEIVGSVYSLSPSPPPHDFSMETAPQPVAERTLRLLAKKMALISKGIEARRGGVQGLCRMAERKSHRAKEVRALVHMMHAERVRMQQYFGHAELDPPKWSDGSQTPPQVDKGKGVANERADASAAVPEAQPVTEEEREETADSLSVVAMLSAADDMEVGMPMELAGLAPRPPLTPPNQHPREPWS